MSVMRVRLPPDHSSCEQAKSDVNCTNGGGDPLLHFTARLNQVKILQMLLARGVDVTKVDRAGNTALHVAVERGNQESVETLLRNSAIDVNAKNAAGQTVLHSLAMCATSNVTIISSLLLNTKQLHLDERDNQGNTALYTAFRNSAKPLCRALVEAGAHVGIENNEGRSVLDPENMGPLLLDLLVSIPMELAWLEEGRVCQNCKQGFTMIRRKHHCRNCARLLCSACSGKEIPMPKFNMPKPQRVCEMCHSALTTNPVRVPFSSYSRVCSHCSAARPLAVLLIRPGTVSPPPTPPSPSAAAAFSLVSCILMRVQFHYPECTDGQRCPRRCLHLMHYIHRQRADTKVEKIPSTWATSMCK
jgi:hypothetical protein